MPAYSPISPLPSNWSDMRGAQLASLADAWKQQRVELDESDAMTQFLARLRREWAIETGVIERLYTISDSATKTLIDPSKPAVNRRGFESLSAHCVPTTKP
jgi:hypothetical protein